MRSAPKVTVFHEAGKKLTLLDYDTHHELLFEKVPILTSATLGTERTFGAIAKRFSRLPAPRILVGGLGFGATLSSVLEVSNQRAEVIVVEKLETVVSLVAGRLSHINPGVLDDHRTRLINDDVANVIANERNLDLILLDVDNGPDWASFRQNSRLYSGYGLRCAFDSLNRGGVYAVWSGYPADAFCRKLRRAGFSPSIQPMYERGKLQARAYIGRKNADCIDSR